MKVKVLIGMDEWYPVYDVSTEFPNDPNCLEIEEETLRRWLKVFTEFDEVQEEIENLYKETP